MKKTFLSIVLGLFFLPLFAQEPELGLPGDNLNLYGVLNIFQNSPTLEEFEKKLNAEDSKVNNLDLNGDGKIDYIHVVDNMNGAAHAIALRVDVNESETQDVAVIEVERDANNQVHVQIVGDEALYGKDYIVEPNQNTPNPGYQSGDSQTEVATTVYPSPATWAIIGFMFAPSYIVYSSPYHWGYYPHFWHPWYPISYPVFYGYHRPYYNYYRRSYYYHSPAAHAFYGQRRVYSPIVRERYHVSPNNHLGNSGVRPVPNHNNTPRPINNQQHQINNNPRPINNNQQHQINNNPRPINNNQQHQINNNPRPINNNQQHQINNNPRPINNNQQHQINNNPRPINNNQQHQINNNPRPINNNQQHQINNNPRPVGHSSPQPVRTNSGKKNEPPRK
jgi:hypothetical protein